MRINLIEINNVKGRSARIELSQPHLLLVGEIGSGKSAVIDGVRLALMQPTGFGDRGLDRLSPTGNWSAALQFEGEIRRLERSLKRNKQKYMVNGRQVDQKEYRSSVDQVIAVEPHHVALDAFLGLSGQKRAALFSDLLEEAEQFTLEQAVEETENCDIGEFFRRELGDSHVKHVAPLVSRLGVFSGTPSELLEALKTEQNTTTQAERDAKARIEHLGLKQASVSHGMTAEEVKNKIQAIDEQLGGLKTQIENIDVQRERYEAAQAMVTSAAKAVEEMQHTLTCLQATASQKQAHTDTAEAKKHTLAIARKLVGQLEGAKTKLDERTEQLDEQIKAMERGKRLVADLLTKEWDVDIVWLRAEFETFTEQCELDRILGRNEPVSDEQLKPAAIAFAREIVAEVLGGPTDVIDQKLEGLRQDQALHKKEVATWQRQLADATEKALEAAKAVDAATAAVEEAEKTEQEIPALKEETEAKDKERAQLQQKAQQTAPPENVEIVTAQQERLNAERETLAAQLKEYESSRALSGQLEEARYAATVAESALDAMKTLMTAIQVWRDRKLAGRVKAIMEPFNSAFTLLFGEDVHLAHHAEGTGRGTEFTFTIDRKGFPVPFDLLSDGETVLTAAAFLSALQRIKDTPGTMLTMNTEALSAKGLKSIVRTLPALKLDFVAVANNHGNDILADLPPSWMAVDMNR